MAALFRIVPHELRLTPQTRLLKAAEWAAWLRAGELLESARLEAERLREEAVTAAEEEKRRGYEDGMLEGRMRYAESMVETVGKAVDYLDSMESGVIRLVGDALRKILGALPPEELIADIVRRSLALVQGQKRVTLSVSPVDAPALRARLDEILRGYPGIQFIDVKEDQRLSAGGCVLESEMGIIDASLETQVRAIANAMEKRRKG